MPQNQSITIKDGASTPVDHVFAPSKIDANNVATFQERTSGVPVGYPTLTWALRAPTQNSPTYKATGRLSVPKVVTVTGTDGRTATSVDYTNLASIDLVFSNKSTKQERKDIRVMVSNLLVNSAIVSASDDLESFW